MRISRLIPALVALMPILPAAEPQPARDRVMQGINQFAAELYPKLARNGENTIFSPLSVFAALSMVLNGARGETAKEIAAILHQPYPDVDYNAALSEVVSQMIQSVNGSGTELSNANGLWVDKALRIRPQFLQALEKFYSAPQLQLNFQDNPEGARAEINRWTAERTKDKIVNLFGPGAFDQRTRLVLSSAIYFNGKWQSAFKPQSTQSEPFRLASGATIKTPFMNQSGEFGYVETPAVQILEMKYADGLLGLDVLLPKNPKALGEFENPLGSDHLGPWFRSLRKETVEVSLPKFRTETAFPLRETLSQMGMASAFGSDADFSGIDDRRDLYLSRVIHKAFVDVSEEGTEAAAATGVAVNLISAVMPRPQRIVFRADHPFVFLIRDTRSGVILFAGRLMNPAR
jgi:serpin B